MASIKRLQPQNVFSYFEQLASIPHGSGNTKGVSDFCVSFAVEQGLEYIQDEVGNVIIKKPASKGYENAPTMILQGHLDMVCVKEPNLSFDFARDALQLKSDGEWLRAAGTTLGADNGIAVAMTLALLADKEAQHPALEAVFTIDEEVGLDGAKALDTSVLTGKYLLNLDSEEEGVLTAGCAGGQRADCVVPVTRKPVTGIRCSLVIDGLLGGHSGGEIDKGRGNSHKLMGRLLRAMEDECFFCLSSITGGSADNAIPNKTEAELIVPEESVEELAAVAAEYQGIYARELRASDPGVKVTFTSLGKAAMLAADEKSTSGIIFVLVNTINGIQYMSMELPGLVQSSLNMGVVRMDESSVTMSFAVRSSIATQKEEMSLKLKDVTEAIGGSVSYRSAYPAWDFRPESKLRDMMNECYKEITGEELKVTATHGGLECGILSDKMPELDCVSFGPTIQNAHSVKEQLNVQSTERTYKFLLEVLKNANKLD